MRRCSSGELLAFVGERRCESAPRTHQFLAPARLLVARSLLLGVQDAAHVFHAPRHPTELREQRVGDGAVLLQILPAKLGDVVELARALDFNRRMPEFLEVRQGGVDHAGTRDVKAFGALIQRPDDFVAMPRLVREQPQDHQLQIDGRELAAHAEGLAAHPAPIHESPAEPPQSAMPAAKKMMQMTMHSCLSICCKIYLMI